MKKKGSTRFRNKKGQLTVFMILGLILLFVFIFLLVLATSIKKSELSNEQEKILTSIFGKEALRIYIEDCLSDGIVAGLQELGEKGGLGQFIENQNGVLFNDKEVFYAIAKEDLANYPCKGESCQYIFPERHFFGKNKIKESVVEEELSFFLEDEVAACVQEKIFQETSETVIVNSEEAEFSVDLTDQGANVQVYYPIKLNLRGLDLVHLSEFSFFYKTKIRDFLKVTIIDPLNWDWQLPDFNLENYYLNEGEEFVYGSEVEVRGEDCLDVGEFFKCTKKTFHEKYANLGIEYALFINVDGQGTDIFEIRATSSLGEGLEDYVFRYARQNRQPVLDYISRCPAQGYDYLVLPNTEISLYPRVHEPDEDGTQTLIVRQTTTGEETREELSFPFTGDFTVKVIDDHGLENQQKVRVKLDNVARATATFQNLVDDSNALSLEDPFCITVEEINTRNVEVGDFKLKEGNIDTTIEGSKTFPSNVNSCSFTGININDIDQEIRSYGLNIGSLSLNLEGEITYPGDDPMCTYALPKDLEVNVMACLPYSGDEGRLAYVPGEDYHNFKKTVDANGENFFEEDLVNPFFANHACCVGGEIVDEATCFDETGCFENQYLLQRQTIECDGLRGNVCGGEPAINDDLVEGKKICGNSNFLGCNQDIPVVCSGKKQFSLIDDEGWCYGQIYGCEELWEGDVVFKNQNHLLLEEFKEDVSNTHFAKGCKQEYENQNFYCDSNQDWDFLGRCDGNRCIGDS